MRLPSWFIGEFTGTFLLVFFGCGSVCSAVLTGALVGVFQVALVWGLGVAIAIYLTAGLSGAHLNPAVTVALAVWEGFPPKRILPYVLAQMMGAFVAAAVLFVIFQTPLIAYETAHQIVRGTPGSEATAMVFGEFFPNPGGLPLTEMDRLRISHFGAFIAEVVGTAVLLFVVGYLSDQRKRSFPRAWVAMAIGVTLTLLICVFSPLTMACFNPARDLAPRFFSALAGWGSVPFTVNGVGWFTVYILAPIWGGLIGAGAYRRFDKGHFLKALKKD